MNAFATWQSHLSFTGGADSGYELQMSSDVDLGGLGGFRPLELVAIGLAGCTAMDVLSILKKKRQAITRFEVRIQADQAVEHPMVFTHAVIEYEVTGNAVDEAAATSACRLRPSPFTPIRAPASSASTAARGRRAARSSTRSQPVPARSSFPRKTATSLPPPSPLNSSPATTKFTRSNTISAPRR